jgi:4-amino-4-deoxychorismate lyase
MHCWVNGTAQETVGAADRGLAYGDGLFETMAVRHGRILLLERHLARLARGCDRLGIAGVPAAGLQHELLRAAGAPDVGVVKLILTRGIQQRGYRPDPAIVPTRIVAAYPASGYPAAWAREGVQLRVCALRLSEQPRLAGIKHLNRLEQVLARQEWSEPVPQEGLLLDAAGRVIGGTMTNVFACIDGQLVTPSLARCGVAGVMRELVMDIAASRGIACQQRDLPLPELLRAREIFLTNSLIGIWPVLGLADHRYQPGPLSLDFAAEVAHLWA